MNIREEVHVSLSWPSMWNAHHTLQDILGHPSLDLNLTTIGFDHNRISILNPVLRCRLGMDFSKRLWNLYPSMLLCFDADHACNKESEPPLSR